VGGATPIARSVIRGDRRDPLKLRPHMVRENSCTMIRMSMVIAAALSAWRCGAPWRNGLSPHHRLQYGVDVP
jgi:hypothetical protein